MRQSVARSVKRAATSRASAALRGSKAWRTEALASPA
jgi:hypothetical protein